MDAVAGSKAAALASAKVVKNAKGNIVPSSQMAHIVYGCGEFVHLRVSVKLIMMYRTHGRDVRERPQADSRPLPIDPPAYTRQAERNSTDIRRLEQPANCLHSPALSLLTVPEHHDGRAERPAFRYKEPLLLWVATWP